MGTLEFGFTNAGILKVTKRFLLVLLLPVMYVIAVPFALNPAGNATTILQFFTYSCFFLLLMRLKESPSIKKALTVVFQLLGFGLIVCGFVNVLGHWIYVACSVQRICGPVQYPNTFASLLGAYLLYTIALLDNGSSKYWVGISLFALSLGYGALFINRDKI
ncbi:hypothetical protein [Radiobacillus sp. PE A8.2]|uniref:hypothetical protein n=1 Tax=Radiobacillus sp. PE A8.2 TaxID=3380349 RepID=UPI0038905D4A